MKAERGFSLIELLIVVAIIGIIAAIAVPNLLKTRQAANEASAISSIRTITVSQAKYQSTDGRGKDFATSLAALGADGLIDTNLASGIKSGFNFSMTGAVSTTTSPSYFDVTGWPSSAGSFGTGRRSFYSNETYVIYQQDGSVTGVWGTTATNRIPAAPATAVE